MRDGRLGGHTLRNGRLRDGLLEDGWLRGSLLRVGWLGGGLLRDSCLRNILFGAGLLRIGLLWIGLSRNDSWGNEQGCSSRFSSTCISHVHILWNSPLLSVADGSLTKVLYRICIIKAVLLPRVNRVIRHLKKTEVGTPQLTTHRHLTRNDVPCCAGG